MKIETVKGLVNGTGVLAGSTGIVTSVMAYLKAEALGIGALCTILTLVVYIFFQFIHDKRLTKADENKVIINKILNKLDKLDKLDGVKKE